MITYAKLTVQNERGQVIHVEAMPAEDATRTTPQDAANLVSSLGHALGAATAEQPGFIDWSELAGDA